MFCFWHEDNPWALMKCWIFLSNLFIFYFHICTCIFFFTDLCKVLDRHWILNPADCCSTLMNIGSSAFPVTPFAFSHSYLKSVEMQPHKSLTKERAQMVRQRRRNSDTTRINSCNLSINLSNSVIIFLTSTLELHTALHPLHPTDSILPCVWQSVSFS